MDVKSFEEVKQELSDFLNSNLDKSGIPSILKSDWIVFRDRYERLLLRKALAEIIVSNKYPFPFREYDFRKDVQDKFYKLKQYNTKISKTGELWYEKHDYKNSYNKNLLGIIPSSGGRLNSVSDYYHQQIRLKVGGTYHTSPYDSWVNGDGLLTKLCIWWNDKMYTDMNSKCFMSQMFSMTYLCSQFKPDVAKLLYNHVQANSVIDLSCGWGDRLAGFYASNAKTYIGTDPNTETFNAYKKQCIDYEKFLGTDAEIIEYKDFFECKGSKFVRIYNLPAEDVDWNIYKNQIDTIFTSPPYFDLEQYDRENENQSWKRYSTMDNWRDNFLFKIIEKSVVTLKPGGLLLLNITESKIPKDNYFLCDHMVDFTESLEDMHYIGKFGMAIGSRPIRNKDSDEKSSKKIKTIEPIWCFRKGDNSDVLKQNLIEDFF